MPCLAQALSIHGALIYVAHYIVGHLEYTYGSPKVVF